jgi:hypothetical protein
MVNTKKCIQHIYEFANLNKATRLPKAVNFQAKFMNSQIVFIIKSLLVGVFAASLFIGGVYLFFANALKHMNFMGGGSTSHLTPTENTLAWLGLATTFISLFICPLYTFFVLDTFDKLAEKLLFRALIITTCFCLQPILLITAYYFAGWYNEYSNYKQIQKNIEIRKPFQELVQNLSRSNISVVVKKAKILSDDGKYVKSEITLQIKNVPNIIPYYEMNIHEVGNMNDNLFSGGYEDKERKINGVIKVVNENGEWIFKDYHPNQIVSANADEVVIRCGFFRENATQNMLPETITPRLGIWNREDKVYLDTYQFFYKPIPIKFEK